MDIENAMREGKLQFAKTRYIQCENTIRLC